MTLARTSTLLVLLASAGCAQDPCKLLLEKQCAAAGAEWCDQQRKAVEGRESTDAEKLRCQAVLDDPKQLELMAEGLKRSIELEKEGKGGLSKPDAPTPPK